MSRCTTPWSWACFSARHIWMAIASVSFQSNRRPALISCSRLGPSTSSIE